MLLISVSFGLFTACYVGMWRGWVGSVVDLIKQCKLDDPNSGAIALDLLCFFVLAQVCIIVGFWIATVGFAYCSCQLTFQSREKKRERIKQSILQKFELFKHENRLN